MGVIPTDFVYDQAKVIYNDAEIGEVLPERLRTLLTSAFLWASTPQGWEYWHDLKMGKRKWSIEDAYLFCGWLDLHKSFFDRIEEPKTEDIQWA